MPHSDRSTAHAQWQHSKEAPGTWGTKQDEVHLPSYFHKVCSSDHCIRARHRQSHTAQVGERRV